jgi:hypothetical protein
MFFGKDVPLSKLYLMKQFLLFLFTLCLTGATQAQTTLTDAYFPVAGDTLRIATDNQPEGIILGGPGGPMTWDFGDLQAPFANTTVYKEASSGVYFNQFPGADLLVELPAGGESYYNVTSGAFENMGYFGADPINLGIELLVPYQPNLVERRAPLDFIDQHVTEPQLLIPFSADMLPQVILDNLPIVPDSIRINISFERQELVDAYGELTIPGGTFEVLRQKQTEIRETKVEAKILIFDWQDVTGFIPGNEFLGKDTTINYVFYSNDAKEPIASVNVDPQTEEVNSVSFKSIEGIVNSTKPLGNVTASVYAYPNPAIDRARFDFLNLPPEFYTLQIYNILGIKVWEEAYWVSGSRTEEVDLSQLQKGTYLYSLVDADGKTIITRRLMVVRP